jgi:3'-phosphoadenosine 5'-phosphosulfate sulfotransferase (PAPS reductase)/FAD synthetase
MMKEPTVRVLNLGAGVQSSTLALLASRGEFGLEKPDCAIFADTGWESGATYKFLDWLEPQLAFPVHRVRATETGLRSDMVAATKGKRSAGVPLYTESDGGGGTLRRICTTEYKIQPIERKIRELLGVAKGKRVPKEIWVEQWFGISKDEIYRIKESNQGWIKRRWPLVFELGWSRSDCLRWWEKQGLPVPPRSACIGCPYHSDKEWREMKDRRPDEWADAVEFDGIIRTGTRGTTQKCYLHKSRKPLEMADLSTAEDHGQLSLFMDECEGMCGI